MAQASRSVTVNVPPEKLFEVITDYEKYPEFLPEVKKAKVEFGAGNVKEVTYTVDLKAKVITYTLKHTARPPDELAWTMVRGEMMKGNDGAWILKDLILPTFEAMPIAAIHEDLVQEWAKKLSQAGYAATTVKKAFG